MLPTVDFCGLEVTRLVIGANPFGGFSHQNKHRDREMLSYSTVERIKETWARAEAAGINTMVTNNTSSHVVQAVDEYLRERGGLQWIAQIQAPETTAILRAVDEAVEVGCSAIYLHGAVADNAFATGNAELIHTVCDHIRGHGIPAGVAGHAPDVHHWVDTLNVADFHAVCCFNCGSLHAGRGHKFQLQDIFAATECIRRIQRPCIAYKILGAGRIEPRMGFEYAFERIKPGDVVNVGMHRGDKDDMVEENATLVRELLGAG